MCLYLAAVHYSFNDNNDGFFHSVVKANAGLYGHVSHKVIIGRIQFHTRI